MDRNLNIERLFRTLIVGAVALVVVLIGGLRGQPDDTETEPVPQAQPQSQPQAGARHAHRVVGYFTAWAVYGRNFHVADVRAEHLTHINYAFANIRNGECVLGDPYADTQKTYSGDKCDDPLRGNFRQLQRLKDKHPHLKTLISVGGWTWSGQFSDLALTRESRARFAKSCAAFIVKYGFDGVDIDWEYPVGGGLPANRTRPADKQNYTLLLRDVRAELDRTSQTTGVRYLLTIAAPAGPKTLANLELDKIHQHLDWINLMTYDFHGAWDSRTGFHAPLCPVPDDPTPGSDGFSVKSAVETYRAVGIPADKLVVGVPFYGRAWRGVPATNRGLHQPATGAAPGRWEVGFREWKEIAENLAQYQQHWHEQARAPYLYRPEGGEWVTHETPRSIREKVGFVVQQELGGVMIWELSQDTRGDDSLLKAITNEFKTRGAAPSEGDRGKPDSDSGDGAREK